MESTFIPTATSSPRHSNIFCVLRLYQPAARSIESLYQFSTLSLKIRELVAGARRQTDQGFFGRTVRESVDALADFGQRARSFPVGGREYVEQRRRESTRGNVGRQVDVRPFLGQPKRIRHLLAIRRILEEPPNQPMLVDFLNELFSAPCLTFGEEALDAGYEVFW